MDEIPTVDNRQNIKLFKNTKGYNWEIKCIQETGELQEDWINRLTTIDTELANRYGKQSEDLI